MKRVIPLVLACLLCLSLLSACQTPGEEKLICGITKFEPMNYLDENGDWTGFDTEFAKLVGEKLNMTVEFQEIDWDGKYSELESGAINCIWNGFTGNASDDGKPRSESVDLSYGYMLNQQCVVVKADRADEFNSLDALTGKKAAAESGSAGAEAAKEAIGDAGEFIGVTAQTNAFTEVKAGAVDCAVVDILLAEKLVGTGDFADLVIADIEMESEIYAIGFKKGSALTAKVNKAMKELYDDGTLEELAKKYGLENSLKLDTNFKG